MSDLEWEDVEPTVRLDEVLDALGVTSLYTRKNERWSSCPLPSHPGRDARPSFSVNEASYLWSCFTCAQGGKLPSLVVALEQAQDWDEAIHFLVPFSDVTPDEDALFVEQIRRYLSRPERPPKAPRAAALPSYNPRLVEGLREPPPGLMEEHWHVSGGYAHSEWGVGYDPAWKRGDYLGPALIIPHWFDGKLVGWQERWLDDDRPNWIPKYTNTEGFPRGETIFGYKETQASTSVIVVESALTTIRLMALGYPTNGTFGVSITDEQFKLLRRYEEVYFTYDNDPDYVNTKGVTVTGAGPATIKKNIAALDEYVATYVIDTPPGEKSDLADIDDAAVHELVRNATPGFIWRANTK